MPADVKKGTSRTANNRLGVDNLVRLHEVGAEALGHDRAVNLPALGMTPPQMTEALLRVADRPLGPVRYHLDPAVVAVLRGWPQHWSSERARGLGLVGDAGPEAFIRAYLADLAHLGGPVRAGGAS